MFDSDKIRAMQDPRKAELKEAYLAAGGSAFVFSIATYDEIKAYLDSQVYKIWLVNFGYYLSETFTDINRSIAYGKDKGFEFRVDQDNRPVCAWSIFGGLKYF